MIKKVLFTFFLFLIAIVCLNSCKNPEGCIDPFALNFDGEAEKDDGSCNYAAVIDTAVICDTAVSVIVDTSTSNIPDTTTVTINKFCPTMRTNQFYDGQSTYAINKVGLIHDAFSDTVIVTADINLGNTANSIVIKLHDGLPIVSTKYRIEKSTCNAIAAELSIFFGADVFDVPVRGHDAEITITPLSLGQYQVDFSQVELYCSKDILRSKSFCTTFIIDNRNYGDYTLGSGISIIGQGVRVETKGKENIWSMEGVSAIGQHNKVIITLPADAYSKVYYLDRTSSLYTPGVSITVEKYGKDGMKVESSLAKNGIIRVVKSRKKYTLSYFNVPLDFSEGQVRSNGFLVAYLD